MFTPNWITAGYKSMPDAILAMLELIEKSPGCAGTDGKVGLMVYNTFITITPKKRKKDE